ncbi:hypothetical protein GCM10009733_006750 [Nonomuraea maheshkhaliensis]|uniref:HPP family protein n=2 Tax=Nonomuraea maheshkhaliensis TaxID=419590 RepID=A0ABN2EQM2_9ACTN
MVVSTTTENTSVEGWAVDIPFLRAGRDRSPVRITGNSPTFHSLIYFGGLAGPTRIAMAHFGPTDPKTIFCAYLACVIGALLMARLIRTKAERTARMISSALGLAGFAMSTTVPTSATPIVGSASTAVWLIPLAATAFMVLLNGVGEVMCRIWPDSTEQVDRSRSQQGSPATSRTVRRGGAKSTK